MKIGIDCRLWNESGVGRYTRNLIQQLEQCDKNNNYVLFALEKDIANIQENVNDNKKWKITKAPIRWHSFEEQFLLTEILNKEELDVMHFPYFSVPIFYKKPFVVTIHDLILHHFPTGEASTLQPFQYKIKLFAYQYIIRKAANNARKVITVSQATKDELVKHLHLSQKKIAVIYEGINELKIQDDSINKLVTNQKYFLHVGNVYPHKNVPRLIEAFEKVIEQESNIKLVFIGRNDYFFEKIQKLIIEKKIEDSVYFLGDLPDKLLFSYYKHACALVISSLMEGFGLPAIEAMSQNCLVLASSIPSLQEVCGNAALYFDPYNPQDIANVMAKTLQLPTKEKNERNSCARELIKKYSWQTMAKETLKIYESSIGI